jgi:putative hydrolase of the HAD superfamily
LKLRAVIFDYGMVLSGPPDASIQAEMLHRSGIPAAQAEALYWKHRHDYDRGDLNGLSYWQTILDEGGVAYPPELIAELAQLDARMWTSSNQPLVDWQAKLRAAGLKTAILSNLGDVVKESVVRNLPWVRNFDVQVFSYLLRVIKPAPAIYLHTLAALGTAPEETLFLDDLPANVEAARALGIIGIPYTGVADLKQAIRSLEIENSIPLPQ